MFTLDVQIVGCALNKAVLHTIIITWISNFLVIELFMVIFTGPILPLPTAGVGNPYQNFSWTQLHDTLTEKVQQNDDLSVVPYMGMYMPPIILVILFQIFV